MSEIDRLYSYRTLLTGRRAVPRDEILSKLEISQATFKRDLAKLRDRLNIPVVFDRDLGGYRLDNTDTRQELPGLWFSQDEILALLTIQNMLEQLEPGLLGPKLKRPPPRTCAPETRARSGESCASSLPHLHPPRACSWPGCCGHR